MTRPTVQDARPGYRPYLVTVTNIVELSPHFVRVTFSGPALDRFGNHRLDQRIKLMFPHADGSLTDFGFTDPDVIATGDWHRRWRSLPDDVRNPIRTFTIRHVRNSLREIDVDFFRHDSSEHQSDGAASGWLRNAARGDRLVIVGPDAGSTNSRSGIEWNPGTAGRLLLAGDETAVPAMANIIETLDKSAVADVFIELETLRNTLPLGDSASVTWLEQQVGRPGEALATAIDHWVRTTVSETVASSEVQTLADVDIDNELLWEAPESGQRDIYIWLAGEAGVVKSLRRLLVQQHNIDKSCIAFMGYWRRGRAESS
jgi:NADPH-dependent ferric siderophore reductase